MEGSYMDAILRQVTQPPGTAARRRVRRRVDRVMRSVARIIRPGDYWNCRSRTTWTNPWSEFADAWAERRFVGPTRKMKTTRRERALARKTTCSWRATGKP